MSQRSSLNIGQDVITAEADGLRALSDALDQSFIAAVDAILAATGHVIVVGIGKSGHIGRKIAASLASTGTPAFFMHPSEAAHGDLGMVVDGSLILALSFSGESAEVGGVLDYAASLGLTRVSITGRPKSSMAQKSDIVLVLPDMPEACPNRLAPTTSSTMTLAMGDALTVAVMESRGFTTEDFGRRHPGGKLGLGLQRVAEYLNANDTTVPFIAETASMRDVIVAMTSGGMGCVAVVKDEALCGIITDGDLRRAMGPDVMSLRAVDIMTASPFTVSPDMRMRDVVTALTSRRITTVFAVEDTRLLGLIDMKSLLATGYV